MKQFVKRFTNIFLAVMIVFVCSACVPPFIDGLVDAKDYFADTVLYSTYTINQEADGGFETTDGLSIILENLMDSDETNIPMQRYLSFVFQCKREVELATVAFIVETQEDAELVFQLEGNTFSCTQSITMTTGRKEIVYFSELSLLLTASEELTISLINPLASNVSYRIDTVVFTV